MDPLSRSFGRDPVRIPLDRISLLKNMEKTLSFISVKDEGKVVGKVIILKDKNMSLQDAGLLLWRGVVKPEYDKQNCMYLHADQDVLKIKPVTIILQVKIKKVEVDTQKPNNITMSIRLTNPTTIGVHI